MGRNHGATPLGSGSHPSDHAPTGHGAARADPSRADRLAQISRVVRRLTEAWTPWGSGGRIAGHQMADELQAMAVEIATSSREPIIEFYQQDFIPGFAAFLPGATTPEGNAFCVLNLGSILSTVNTRTVPAADIPYFIAESMMHELMHALEQWAGSEFSEERIEALLAKYRTEFGGSVSDEHPMGEDAEAAEGEACQRGGVAETPKTPPVPAPLETLATAGGER